MGPSLGCMEDCEHLNWATFEASATIDTTTAFSQVDALFQELGTRLCYERAEDPNAFLIRVSILHARVAHHLASCYLVFYSACYISHFPLEVLIVMARVFFSGA